MSPKLSVIIPCYQAETTLEATLRSVAAQHFHAWECIVVNDGSTDTSPRIAEKYAKEDGRFHVLHQQNAGVSAARNAGIAAAAGPYLHFLDADDIVLADGYARFVAGLDRDPAAAVCYCGGYEVIDGRGDRLTLTTTPPAIDLSGLVKTNFGPPLCAVVRKDFAKRVSGFEPTLSGLADWDFWLRIARAGGRFVRVAGTLVQYRVLPGSMSKNARMMYRDAFRLRQFLVEPDARIRDSDGGSAVSAAQLGHWVVNARSFSLGCAVLARDDVFTNELLAEIKSQAASTGEASFLPDAFAWGVKYASGCFGALSPADLARTLRDIYEGVRRMEVELGHARLVEAVMETLLAPYQEAVRERDQLRASTSYKLGRLVTRCKFW